MLFAPTSLYRRRGTNTGASMLELRRHQYAAPGYTLSIDH
jgi:hypothetical protein